VRKELEADFERSNPSLWDHTHLQLINHSGQNIKVSFEEPTVLSPKHESLQGTAYTQLATFEQGESNGIKQQMLWMLGDAQQQSALSYLGYYKGKLDGLTGCP
jgi:hypothetical protein